MKTRLVLSALFFLTLSACTFSDGEPWGELDASLNVEASPQASRFDERGLKVPSGHRLQIEDLDVEIAALGVSFTALSQDTEVFDPANPPPNYSLCHNGHCHRDDGALVDYEDIVLELGGSSGTEVVASPTDGQVSVWTESVDVPLACGSCELERGKVQRVTVLVRTLYVRGNVESPDGEREADFEWSFALNTEIATPATGLVDRDQPVTLSVHADLDLPESLFDEVDWDDVLDGGSVDAEVFATALEEDATLTVEVSQ